MACNHTWETMEKSTALCARNYEVRRCPRCGHLEDRLTDKGWWNIVRVVGAVTAAVATVAVALSDDQPNGQA